MRVRVLYFASLRDVAGRNEETLDVAMMPLAQLYDDARTRYGFTLPRERLRVAIDGAFSNWDAELHDGAEIAFIPPVSGG
jgi:molybdopterin synthase sulfur carrier subunit